MDIGSLNQFIKKALDYYDNQKLKYSNMIDINKIKYDETKFLEVKKKVGIA